jgi:hypothetical protein
VSGLSRDQEIVDLAAVAAELSPAREEAPPPPPDGLPPNACALGHANAPSARFCGTCGLAMGAPAQARVDLEKARPRAAAELSAEELAERARQHAQAVAAAAALDQAPDPAVLPSEGETILIHFIEDGLTFAGKVWYRGQELEIGPSHPRWPEVVGWITLDKYGQADRWGKQYFEHGPWPGRRSYSGPGDRYEQLAVPGSEGQQFAGPTEAQLRQADDAERQRGRGVPAPLFR